MIKLIVAMDKNNLIGNKNKLPWNFKEEMQHFQKKTMNNALLFGKTTYQGIEKHLKDRIIYVLSENDIKGDCTVIHNDKELKELFDKYRKCSGVLYIAGGKNIYEKYYQEAEELIISRIKGEFAGDVYLNIDLSKFSLYKIDEYPEFSVEYYIKCIDK